MVLQILLSHCSLNFLEAIRAFLLASAGVEARVPMGDEVRICDMVLKL